ncbi:MAG: hypothetical protein HUU22_15855 [Phycisphaerae bacterium]|nr:hypothetical protein [Phycisphaerae bacterium]NUQ47495.1 hypothetical protein [Phycisphaerae bacterium]
MFIDYLIRTAVSVIVLLSAAAPALAQAESWPPEYYQAHYVLTVQNDPAAAAALYEKVYQNGKLSEQQRQAVRSAIDDCNERIVSRELSRLCPPDTIAYLQINQPGALVERITTMMGVETRPVRPMLAKRQPKEPIDWRHPNPAAFIPDEIVLSPALARCLKSFGGIAAAFTGVEQISPRTTIVHGLLILNPGDADLMRGLIEMAAQFGPIAEPIEGCPTYALPYGITAAMTERLVLVGSSRAQVESAVARLRDNGKGSLAETASYKELSKNRGNATAFGFVDAQRLMTLIRPFVGNNDEFQAARALLDLDNLIGASFGLGAIEGGLGLDLSVVMNENHHNLIYNLIRTPSMTRRSLECVPGNAAVVFGFGLNPPAGPAPSHEGKSRALKSVTGLDIFRELFGNIEELAVYAAPMTGGLLAGNSDAAPPFIPNAALIIAAGDADKSHALWTQLLSIPSMAMPNRVPPPRDVEIGGQNVTAFALPEGVTIYVGRINNCLVVSGRKESINAVFRTAKGGKSILQDKVLEPIVSRMNPNVGVVVIAHGGRLAQLAAGMAPAFSNGNGPPPAVLTMMSTTLATALETTMVYIGVAESDTEFNVRICLAGLPNVNQLLKQFGPMARTLAGMPDRGPPRDPVARALPQPE